MRRALRIALALLLLPLAIGCTWALFDLLARSGRASAFWITFGGGIVCWIVIYLLLPRPLWLYVLGHELTHAVWAWLFGARVKRIKVTSQGGFVEITKTNFLIALAPYFFPFYAAVLLAIYGSANLLWDLAPYRPLFHLGLGGAYAFHATLTLDILRTRQSDISGEGILFSCAIIWLGNLGVLLLALPALTDTASYAEVARACAARTRHIYSTLAQLLHWPLRIRS